MVSKNLQFIGAFLLPLFAIASSFDFFHGNNQRMEPMGGDKGPFIPHEYVRFADVKRQCQSVLSDAAELTFDANRANALMPELSFVKGDWKQDVDGAPLMPFDGTDVAGDAADGAPEPLSLASFMLTHVDVGRRGKTALNVSGVLGVAISRNGTGPEMGPYVSPEMKLWPGSTEIKILFEGVYTENGDGESVLCMVGNALLPRRGNDAGNPWDWAKNTDRDNFQPPITKDENVLLVLRYPKTLTLTTRAVRGELTSTNGKSDAAYFDAVQLLSQLGGYSNYKFGSEELVDKACSSHPYRDDILGGGRGLYKGRSYCGILDRFTSEDILAVVPNWRCNSTDALCRRLGPFETDKAIDATDGVFTDVSILMQDVRCEPTNALNGVSSARVSAVFRAVPPWEHKYAAGKRSGLSGMTLSVEGVWRASTGQLCMVGCLGVGKKACHSRVCLYVQTTFTITHRSITVGQISRVDGSGGVAHFPLTIKRTVHPSELWHRFGVSGGAALSMAYNYTKHRQAGEFLRRSEPFDFGTVIAKSLLSYPRKAANLADDAVSLSNLADDLSLHVAAVPDPFPRERFERPFLQLEVLSLESLVGRTSQTAAFSGMPEEQGGGKESSSTSSQPESSSTSSLPTELSLLNVSAELTLPGGKQYENVSTLFLEGVYNPVDGRMYLIGCRSIQVPRRAFLAMKEVEDGMDCSIEMRVEYPPTTARWLINPTAKVHIASTRDPSDPLHFNATVLQTLPIMYQTQRQDILSRRSVEGILRIATLTGAIAAEFSQLMYIKANTDVMPYVSLVMLGVQAVGYSVPLITGAEALFARIAAVSDGTPPSYEVDKSSLYWTIDCIVKILILAAFLLTLRLGQKVWRSRIRLLTRSPLEPGRVPSDRKVLLYSFGAHLVGFTVILMAHYVSVYSRPVRDEGSYMDSRGKTHALREWAVTLEEYIGLAQDLYLLPQVIGNVVWRINCKPLKKSYYTGVTAVRLLPHLYDYIKTPAINPYFAEEYEFVNTSLDFYSRFGDVAIPLAAVALAAAVYVQQRWNYKIISKTVKTQQKKLQHLGSRVYERLPSMSSGNFEAELVSGVNEGVGLRRDGSLS
ncbi:uncharacterized protein LOC133909818 [Phragmites australis]|uniref:uncharacterized protein LOC133909818 n=1 Tax=Phragmites australis TaxID=29695 RepID=UPI002D76ABF1|nr:uncharacterized protein LOC133909818 [Phragmites australis]